MSLFSLASEPLEHFQMTMCRRAACRAGHAFLSQLLTAFRVSLAKPLYDDKMAHDGGGLVSPAKHTAMIMCNADHVQVAGGNSKLHHNSAMKAYATICQSPA
jgi:hypothetical protein